MSVTRPNRSPAARPSDDELLDGALSVIAETGVETASMDAIAERANCTKPTLYAHFGSKEALWDALVARETSALERSVTAAYDAAEGLRPRETIERVVSSLFDFATIDPRGFRLLFGTANAIATPRGQRLLETLTDRLAQMVRAGTRHRASIEPNADLIAAMGMGASIYAAHQALRDGADLDGARRLAVGYVFAANRGITSVLE